APAASSYRCRRAAARSYRALWVSHLPCDFLLPCWLWLCDLFIRRAEKADAFVDDVQLDNPVLLRVANDAHRLAAVSNDVDLLFQELTQKDDSLVSDAEIFQRSVGDAALRLPRHRVLRGHGAQVKATVRPLEMGILKRRVDIRRRAVRFRRHEAHAKDARMG